MKIIDRYIAWELLTSMILGLGLFTFVLLTKPILKLMDLFITKLVPFGIIVRLLLYTLPPLLVLTTPMALLLAVIATYGRLTADHELTALRTTGSSLYRLIRPAFAIGVLGLAFTAFNTLYAVPYGSRAFRDLLFLLARTRATVGIQERIFNDDFHGLILYTNHIEEASGELEGVFVVDTHDEENPRIITARRGRVASDERQNAVLLELQDGSTHVTPKEESDRYEIIGFQNVKLSLSMFDPTTVGAHKRRPDELTVPELLATVRERNARGERTTDLLLNLHWRFVGPVACLVFVLLGTPLAIRVRRSGRGISLGLTIVLTFIYYVLMVLGQGLGKRGIVSPSLASWLPNLLLGSLGLLFLIGGNSDSWLPRPLLLGRKRRRTTPKPLRVP